MIALLVMTDGRPTVHETIASAEANLIGPITECWIHDDSGNPAHTAELRDLYSDWTVIQTPGRSGFGGAIRSAWTALAASRCEYIFHLEDDFTHNRPVDLDAMIAVLADRPYLVQLALRRQPWNDDERAAGGIVEQHPDDYIDCSDGDHHWLEHRRFFTTNPSLYRKSLLAVGWPRGLQSEGRFSHQLLASPKVRFGFWGSRDSGEAVTHIGHQRVGVGY